MASVLVVDDHEGTRDTYARILQLAGYDAATAATGRAGVDLALVRAFDVHLVDLRLPDMSGIEVLQRPIARMK
jgi:DNA-binding response OmpR family regulator